ncbi:hypothetical protein ACQ33O_01240 [Ferruginibacter sp. SUN002]|uniref:hypothetical protein n=1 Tax=Ferruginibacter sp. SUN002 TaxID=2937789 RepID=UPI003D35FD0A
MEKPVEIFNNFKNLKNDFKADTGLDVNSENMSTYIAYYNARINDMSYQTLKLLNHQLINKIDHLPDMIRLRIAEMITDHPIIKQLTKK